MSFQLRGEDEKGNDTGEIVNVDSLQEAFEKFVAGGYWKLSWTASTGKRIRLLRQGEDMIRIADINSEVEKAIKEDMQEAAKELNDTFNRKRHEANDEGGS